MIQGQKPWSMIEGRRTGSSGFGVALFVGYHTRAGHPTGDDRPHVLGRPGRDAELNGRLVGEERHQRGSCSAHGACRSASSRATRMLAEEIAEWLPWAERVVVKGVVEPAAPPPPSTPWRRATTSGPGAERAVRRAIAGELRPLDVGSPVVIEADYRNAGRGRSRRDRAGRRALRRHGRPVQRPRRPDGLSRLPRRVAPGRPRRVTGAGACGAGARRPPTWRATPHRGQSRPNVPLKSIGPRGKARGHSSGPEFARSLTLAANRVTRDGPRAVDSVLCAPVRNIWPDHPAARRRHARRRRVTAGPHTCRAACGPPPTTSRSCRDVRPHRRPPAPSVRAYASSGCAWG